MSARRLAATSGSNIDRKHAGVDSNWTPGGSPPNLDLMLAITAQTVVPHWTPGTPPDSDPLVVATARTSSSEHKLELDSRRLEADFRSPYNNNNAVYILKLDSQWLVGEFR